MVRPSNPKLMARVLDAVTHLAEGKGSLTRDVLNCVKQNTPGPKRNLTMQVRRALKHAVNAGLLRCKSGRYKMQLDFNSISHHPHHHSEKDKYKQVEVLDSMNDDLPIGGTDPSRRVQDRQRKTTSRKKRTARKNRKRSGTRSTRKRVTKRRTGTTDRRTRKATKKPRRKSNKDEEEDWPTRRRRMEAKSRFEDDEDYDNEEDGEEEEDEEEELRDTRDRLKIKSINEDTASNMSGDSNSVGRHRSRRSKHLADDRRSPPRRGNGDTEGHKKSTRRSTSRRRSQQRQRENRRQSAPEEVEEQREGLVEEMDNEGMEMDEDQGDIDRVGTPPENRGTE